jgi:hypothetical protein
MFWPIVLPFKITFWLFTGILATATLLAPLLKQKRGKLFLITALLGSVAFVPSCAAIMTLLDKHRFGVFQYSTFDEVNDFRVERYLPPASTDITIDKSTMGFRAKFHIKERDLVAYLDDLWARYGDRSTIARTELQNEAPTSPEEFKLNFGDLGWPPLANAIEYRGPVAPNGAGFAIWFSKAESIAYERAGYW